MHFESIRRGTIVAIRTGDGDREGKALRKEGEAWILEGGLAATAANVVKFRRPPRRPKGGL